MACGGQIATDAKSNEITAVPKLLEMLSLKGCTVTVDALNCQRDIATMPWRSRGTRSPCMTTCGDFWMIPPPRRSRLRLPSMAITVVLKPPSPPSRRPSTGSRKTTNGLGSKPSGKFVRCCETAAKTTTGTAYYLLSTPMTPERLGQIVRAHWGVENRLHWTLDVTMNEEQARNRLDNGPHNLAVLRHMALNILNAQKSKISNRRKIKRAGWNNDFLAGLIAQF
jgi:predicted transposase YbfD/YdcC